jgi:hypothetical protein
MPARKLDEDLAPVVEGAQRPPRRAVALDRIAEIDVRIDRCRRDRLRQLRFGVLAAQRDELVLRILPGDRGHIGRGRRAQLHVIGAPVGVDDEVGHEVGRVGFTRMWICAMSPAAALGIADDPAHGVAGGDRAGADELLAGLQGDVGDLPGRHRPDRARLRRRDRPASALMKPSRTGCTRAAALAWLTRTVGSAAPVRACVLPDRLQLAGQRQRLRQLDHDLTGAGGSAVCTAGAASS